MEHSTMLLNVSAYFFVFQYPDGILISIIPRVFLAPSTPPILSISTVIEDITDSILHLAAT